MSREGWKEVVLGDVVLLVTKGTTPRNGEGFVDKGINYIKSESIKYNGQIDESRFAFIDIETHSKFKRSQIKVDDILFSMAGAFLGKNAVVKEYLIPANTNQALAIIRINCSLADANFISLCLRNPKMISYVNSMSAQSAQPNINFQEIRSLPINLPPLPIQKAIAKILGDLDAKIELNRKMNESLGAMAQALFQSWFVDFDPVLDNFLAKNAGNVEALPEPLRKKGKLRLAARLGATVGAKSFSPILTPERKPTPEAIRKLFPDSFVFNDVLEKWVPLGWGVKSLDRIANYQNGLALQKFRPKNENDDFLPVLKISHLKQGQTDGKEKSRIDIKKECIVENGDVIFSWSASLLVDLWCGGKCALNQHLFKVTSGNYPKWFYYLYTKHHLDEFIRIAKDKAVTMGHIKREHLRDANCLIMTDELMNSFNSIFKDLIERQIKTKIETQSLTKLRDTLLPQLISGELSVPEAMLEL